MRSALLSILFIILPTLAHAQEVIASFDKNNISVLNEELRQSASGLKTLRGQVADLLPIDLADSTKITGVLLTANSPTINDILPDQTGHAGEFLTTNGSATSWGAGSISSAVLASIYTWRTGIDPAEGTIKISEITCAYAGTYTIAFKIYNSYTPTYNARGQIYKNGSAVGTLRIASAATIFTEDLTFAAGDKIQLYASSEGGLSEAGNLVVRPTTSAVWGGTTTPMIWSGSGAPGTGAGGSVGDLYLNTGGGASTTLYVKTAATTWTAK